MTDLRFRIPKEDVPHAVRAIRPEEAEEIERTRALTHKAVWHAQTGEVRVGEMDTQHLWNALRVLERSLASMKQTRREISEDQRSSSAYLRYIRVESLTTKIRQDELYIHSFKIELAWRELLRQRRLQRENESDITLVVIVGANPSEWEEVVE